VSVAVRGGCYRGGDLLTVCWVPASFLSDIFKSGI